MSGFVWFLSPFVVGYLLRRFFQAKSDWSRAGLAIGAAALPSFGWFAPGIAFGDGSVFGFAFILFLMFLVPAGVGVHLASLGRSGA